ncbi:MAG: mechanosensitive ion channel family protein [Halobaculum sp.]
MGQLDGVRGVLEGITSTEARLAVTVAVVVASLVTAVLVVPRIVGVVRRLLRRRVVEAERLRIDVSGIDWNLPTRAVVRTVQFVAVLAGGLAVLVVWGAADTALAVVAFLVGTVPVLLKVLLTVGVIGGVIVGIDLLETRLDEYAAESDAINQHQQGIVFRVLQLSVLIAAGIAGLTIWGINPEGLLIGAGFLGIVIGTAARTTIGSLIAGFVLMFSRPFELGDWIEIEGDEGVVADITVINTRIRNQHGEEVVIPNERVANATVTNRTRLGQLRLAVDVGVDYDADVDRAERVASEALAGVGPILDHPTPQVVPKSLGDSAVVLECRFWIDRPSAARRTRARAAVVRSVKAALDDAGIKIPYPQRELTGREETNGFRVAEATSSEATPGADDD